MRIAVLSDIHDHLAALAEALRKVQDCGALLFCGDLCAPFSLKAIAEGFRGAIHTVLGNNDGDPLLMVHIAQQESHITLHGAHADLELAGRRIAMVHYPRLAEGLAALGDCDLVCCGHSHQARLEQVGRTVLLNPGEIMGWKGQPSYAVYDTETGLAEILYL